MTNLDSIFKSRDITFPAKVCLVKVMVFPVAIYRGESQGTNAAIRCWRRQGTTFSLELLKGIQPYQHLDFRGLASRNVIQYFCDANPLEEKL